MNRETRVKSFDCVKWTRETRDRINAEIQDMSHEELSRWFDSRRPTDPFLAELLRPANSTYESKGPHRHRWGLRAWCSDFDGSVETNRKMTSEWTRAWQDSR